LTLNCFLNIYKMYTKKYIRRKKRYNKKTKKGGVGSDHMSASSSHGPSRKRKHSSSGKKISIRGPSYWKRLPKLYNTGTLCKKVPAKNPIIHKCEKYNDKWVEIDYNLENLTQSDSPINIYKVGSEYADLQEGIHNFILYWDETNDEYILVTAYFNAPEYGSKHNMIAKRTEGLTPDTFIISGEIKKEGNQILFHDVSSQYFVDNRCNMSQQMLKITVYEMMDKNGWTKDSLTKEHLILLKQSIIDANSFTKATKDQIVKADFEGFIQILESKTPGVKGPIYRTYIDMITDIMRDSFEVLFEPAEEITVLYEKFKEYGAQKDMATFIEEKCRLNPPVEFDIYDNAECIGDRPKRSCAK
jgi:hypothetical protein